MKRSSDSVFGSSDACVLPSVAELQQSLHSNADLGILGLINSNLSKFEINALHTQGTLINYPVLTKILSQTSSVRDPNVSTKLVQCPKDSSSEVIPNLGLPVSKVETPFIEQKKETTELNSCPNDGSSPNPICESHDKLSQSLPLEKFILTTQNTSVNTATSPTSSSNASQNVSNFVERLNGHNDLSSNSITNSHCPRKNSVAQNWSDSGSLSLTVSEHFNKNWVGENQELNACHSVDILPVLSSNSSCSLPEFPENIFSQCVEDIHCYKCKFCSSVYISLTKEDAISHLTSTHTRELEIVQGDNVAAMDSTTSEWLSSGNFLAPNFRSSFSLVETTSTAGNSSSALPDACIDASSSALPQDANFICGKCQKAFFSLQECQEHLSSIHQVKSSRIREFKQNSDIGRMERQHKVQEKTLCSLAAIKSKTNELKKNVASNGKCLSSYNGLPPVKRKTPKLRRMSRKKLKRELGCYICEFKGCNVRFRLLDNLHYHYKCHINGNSMFACPECTTSAQRWSSMAGHLWRQHVIDLELHACDQCSFRTYSLSLLENLHKATHGEERPYLCDTCGKSFKTNKQLRSHKVIHQPKNGRRQNGECQICHKRFVDKRMQRIHLEMVHKKMKPYLCNYCGYSASSKSTLRMHMRQHTGEKPFSCDKCDYCTSDHNSLRRHKMRHSGEKPYKCPYCKYACIQSSTYKVHLKSKHPGQDKGLMFSCSICCFDTIKEDTYITHMADHKMSAILTTSTSISHPQEEMDGQYISLVEAVQLSLSQSSTSGCNVASDRPLLSALEDDAFQKVVDNIG